MYFGYCTGKELHPEDKTDYKNYCPKNVKANCGNETTNTDCHGSEHSILKNSFINRCFKTSLAYSFIVFYCNFVKSNILKLFIVNSNVCFKCFLTESFIIVI